MSKAKIIDKHSVRNILRERKILSKLKNPFIVNIVFAFQDYENLYLVMDLLTGGDLRYHLNQKQAFSENETKFFISNILLGLENIHENKIIHRDLKPENLLFDEKGYIHITDFGISKFYKKENNADTSGTPGYMAPEVLLAKNHSFCADFYAIGIICYEFLLGQRPYMGKCRKDIKKLILSKEVFLEKNSIMCDFSEECIDFINKCLKRNEKERLGYTLGIKELKKHSWLFDCDWEKLYNKELVAVYIPQKNENFDKKYCECDDKISNVTYERYKNYMKNENYSKVFEGYNYFNFENNIFGTLENETRVSTSAKLNIYDISDSNTNNTNINIEKNIIVCPNKDEKLISGVIKLKRNMGSKKKKIKNENEKNNEDDNINDFYKNNENYSKNQIIDENSVQFENNKLIQPHKNNHLNNNNSDIDNRKFLIFSNINNSNDKNIKNSKKRNISCSDAAKKVLINPIKQNSVIQNQKKIMKNNIRNLNSMKTIDFINFKPKKLSIHCFNSEIFDKKEEHKVNLNAINNNDNNKIVPVLLPPLNKLKQSSPSLAGLNHFRFKVKSKKKTKFVNFKNKIIENNITSSLDFLKPINQIINDRTKYNNINNIINNTNLKIANKNEIIGNPKFEIFSKSLSTANMGNFRKSKN